MFIILRKAKKYSSTRAFRSCTSTRLKHQELVLDNFKSWALVLEACVLDFSTGHLSHVKINRITSFSIFPSDKSKQCN